MDDWSIFWAFPACSLCLYILSIISVRLQGPKAPLVGLRSIFEPRLVANFRFFKNSSSVINEGYTKAGLASLRLLPVADNDGSPRKKPSGSSGTMRTWWSCRSRWSMRLEHCPSKKPTLPWPMRTIFSVLTQRWTSSCAATCTSA